MADTSMLYSTVKNLMGVDHDFGFLPPHGKRLKAGQSFSFPGDLTTRIAQAGNARTGADRRRFKSFERDLVAGRIALESTPRPIFFDAAPLAAITNPTVAATGAVTTATGGLAAGTYIFAYTWVSAGGETTIGSSTSAGQIVVGTTELITLTIPALPSNATSANIYITSAGGAAPATLQLYRTGITATTVACTTAIPTGTAVPGSNTATLPNPAIAPVVNVSGGGTTGGLLQAGAYYLKYTFYNANGETAVSAESVVFTQVAGYIPTVQIQPLPPGATGAKIYLTAAAGASDSETLYMTTTETVVRLSALQVVGAAMPGANTAVLSAPTFAPTIDLLGSGYGGDLQGGRLQAGVYYAKYSFKTAAGETTVSPASSAFTVTAGQVPTLNFETETGLLPDGCTSVNVYLTAAGGSTYYLYKSGLLGRSVPLDIPTGNLAIPQTNTSGGSNVRTARINAGALGVVDTSWRNYTGPN